MADRDEIDQYSGAVHRRDIAHVVRLVVVGVIIVVLIVVGLDNRDDVRIGYAIGESSAPVWIVVVVAGIAGVFIGWLIRHRPR